MSSLGTSSPVSASTFRYLMRWPVARLSWLNEIFFALRGRRVKRDRASHERQTQKTLPIGAGAMYAELLRKIGSDSRRAKQLGSYIEGVVARQFFTLLPKTGGRITVLIENARRIGDHCRMVSSKRDKCEIAKL